MALTANVEPRSFTEALKYKHWKNTMDSELDSLGINKMRKLEELPPYKKHLDPKVFMIKYKFEGTIEKYKAPLVVFGNQH